VKALGRLRGGDEGQALIFVMMISILVLIMLGTASATVLDNIRPTADSVENGQALAAAEAGLENFAAQVNANCSDMQSFACTWLTNGLSSNPTVTNTSTQAGTAVPAADGGSSNESFVWQVRSSAAGFARVVSVGQTLGNNGKPMSTKSLVADYGATPTFTDFEYFTKYETLPADFLNSFYGPRTVQINSNETTNSSLPGPGELQWQGTCTYVSATATPSCDPNHDTSICNDLYYSNPNGPGRATDSAWNNAARRPSTAVQAAMGTDNTFAYYSEQGTFKPASSLTDPSTWTQETHNDTCDSSFEPNMVMNGPVYSQDAYLVDRGKDTGNSGNSMPVFNAPAYSVWDGTLNGVQQPKDVNGGYDRAYPNTDGQISTSVNPQPVYTSRVLDLPPNADDAKPLATCTYTGPTRIYLQQGTAYITSPGTPTSPAPAGPSYCYTSHGNFTNATGGGVVDAQVPVSDTIVYVQNPSNATPVLATSSNPIFDLTAHSNPPAATASNSLAGTWTDNATYSPSQACPATPTPTKRRNFDCETGKSNPAEDMASTISNAVNATMKAGAASTSAMQTNLTNAITGVMNPASLTQPATFTTNAGYYYKVTVGTPTQSTTTTNPATLSPADAFYQSSQSGSYTTTTMSAAISIDRFTCVAMKGSSCKTVADTLIYKGTATGTSSSGTATSATYSWPWFGTGTGNPYTDPTNDITSYDNNEGDAYVEGTLKGDMTIVADHDIVATNNLTYANTNLSTTTDGLALVADHDVRIYRPMTCTDAGTAGMTSPGYCPDDLTGVFNGTLSWPLPTNYPATKYTPDNAPSMTSGSDGVIYASIFTLRGCFMVDNYYRGTIGTSATVYGGLYQYHRGPTSLPYQGRPFQGSKTKMPGIVLTYNYDNMRAGETSNGGLRVPWIPNPVGRPEGSTRTWNVVGISTG
jgi:Tfp pilus assembly protein PilX